MFLFGLFCDDAFYCVLDFIQSAFQVEGFLFDFDCFHFSNRSLSLCIELLLSVLLNFTEFP